MELRWGRHAVRDVSTAAQAADACCTRDDEGEGVLMLVLV